MKVESTKDWRQLIASADGEKGKREDLLAVTLWVLGVEDRTSRLRNSNGDSGRGLLTKLLTEWILWKYPTTRGLPNLNPTKEKPIYELWTERAITTLETNHLSKNDSMFCHEHPIPRSILAQVLIELPSSASDARNSIEYLLRSFSVEVTMLKKEESESLDERFKDELPQGEELTPASLQKVVWCRYSKWMSEQKDSGFRILLVPWWKSEGKSFDGKRKGSWVHGWRKDSSQSYQQVFPIAD